MTVEAYAKINLTLEVFGTRPDGFHELKSIVQPITLSDTLEIERTVDGAVSSDLGYGEKDLIVRAARTLGVGASVHVTKRIPSGAGLGGGSSDAAATLLALNDLYALGWSVEELADLGAMIGSDVPALVYAQHDRAPVLMEGRGERVTRRIPVDAAIRPSPYVVLLNPGVHTSTAAVYARCGVRASPAAGAVNDLEAAAVSLHPEIAAALRDLRSAGAREVRMSGSGSTVFGFAADREEGERISTSLATRENKVWCVTTIG